MALQDSGTVLSPDREAVLKAGALTLLMLIVRPQESSNNSCGWSLGHEVPARLSITKGVEA
ncbi:hypothetical protein [Stenotrophomonas sp.]|uniref:hypothetical protein n=1 Tax=Stenotrophomonas sp. TaxID=69392 RepID=UPI0028AAB437|nr:hypothetical protein [Stenotrophomonas sp.]